MPSTLASDSAQAAARSDVRFRKIQRADRGSSANAQAMWATWNRASPQASEAAAAEVASRILAWCANPDDEPPNDVDQALRETVREVTIQRDLRPAPGGLR